jgi:hypothetical protein
MWSTGVYRDLFPNPQISPEDAELAAQGFAATAAPAYC